MASSVVRADKLTKSFRDFRALDDVSFQIGAGEVVGFLGPNGAGKTTAIRVLTGFLMPDSGRAEMCGFDVTKDPISAKKQLGYLPENNPVYADMRVKDFLAFAAEARALKGKQAKAAIDRAVQRTGLSSVWGHLVGHCSKGFKQRVGLAQALLHDPQLLILDEPTNGLDPLQVVEIRELIRELGKEKTVLLTSHVLSEVEALAGRLILLHQGKLVTDEPLSSQASSAQHNRVRVTSLSSADDLQAALLEVGATLLHTLPARAPGLASHMIEVSFGDESLPEAQAKMVKQLSEAGMALVEFSPQTPTLETMFRNLVQDK